MKHENRWVALFSQTGSEIVEISERLNKWPDAIITNTSNYNKIHPRIQKRGFIKINQTQAKT